MPKKHELITKTGRILRQYKHNERIFFLATSLKFNSSLSIFHSNV
jgi:hypothetical protein